MLMIEYDMDVVFGFVECIMVFVCGVVVVIGVFDVICVDLCVWVVYLGEGVI